MGALVLGGSLWLVSGCGCSDAGCPASLELRVPTELASITERVELVGAEGREGCDRMAPTDCRFEVREDGELWVVFTDAPPVFDVTIRDRAGAPLFERTVRPEFETSQPNGPDCAPTCEHAVVEL